MFTLSTGVLCQFSSTEDICPGHDVIFTCETTINTVVWRVTPAVGDFSSCVVFHDEPNVNDTCGPMDVFTATVSGDDMTPTLSAQSVTDVLNGTRVECDVGDVDEEICIIGQRIIVYYLGVFINPYWTTLFVEYLHPGSSCCIYYP